jgi:hypothetical protein
VHGGNIRGDWKYRQCSFLHVSVCLPASLATGRGKVDRESRRENL